MKKILLLFLLFESLSFTIYSQNWDIRILRQINEHRNVHLDGTFKTFSNIVSPISAAAPILIFGTGLIKKDQELKQKGLVIGASFLVTTLIETTLKHTINRARPFETYPDIQKIGT